MQSVPIEIFARILFVPLWFWSTAHGGAHTVIQRNQRRLDAAQQTRTDYKPTALSSQSGCRALSLYGSVVVYGCSAFMCTFCFCIFDYTQTGRSAYGILCCALAPIKT